MSAPAVTSLAPFSMMSNDPFSHMGKFLKQSDLATLACVSHDTNQKVCFTRNLIKHLDVSFKANRKVPMKALHLSNAIRLHPNFTSIDFSGYANLHPTVRDSLVLALKARNLKAVCARDTNMGCRQDGSPWRHLFWALDPTVQGRETSSLEHLDLEGAGCDDVGFMTFLAGLVSHCVKLKTLIIPVQAEISFMGGAALIEKLSSSLEQLGPNWAAIDDTLVDLLMSQFLPANIKACQLTFKKGVDHSLEKRMELLQFLPLSTMTDIQLSGAKSPPQHDWPKNCKPKHLILTSEMIDVIAAQLKQNPDLQILKLIGFIPSEELVASLVNLIGSIQSTQLRELVLLTNSAGIPDMTALVQALRAKLPEWPQISTIQVNGIHLDQLQVSLNSGEAASQPDVLERISHLYGNLFGEVPNFAAIHGLDQIPIPIILSHYAELHNQLAPQNSLVPDQVIAHYRSMAAPNQNTDWTNPSELIQVLEGLYRNRRLSPSPVRNVNPATESYVAS